jgi:hypothetical protein
MQNLDSSLKKNKPPIPLKGESLFVSEGKNDFLLIGIIFLLLSFFLMGGFFFK